MTTRTQKQILIEKYRNEDLLREFIAHLVRESVVPGYSGSFGGMIAISPEQLEKISNTLGEYSQKLVKIATLPVKQKSAETINYIEDVLEVIQSYTPETSHVVPNLGEVDWSRAFFGKPNTAYGLGKIYNWISLTDNYGVAQLSNREITYENAIIFGAKSIASSGNQPLSEIASSVYFKLLQQKKLPNESYAKEKLVKMLSIKSQNDFSNQLVFNRFQYYFVLITRDNKNLHTISTSLRQKDFIYSPSGLPLFDPITNNLLTNDVSVETSASTDIFSLPNFTKFCIETLRVFEVSPESWLAKEIMQMPPDAKVAYLKWIKGILVTSAVISTIFSGGVVGAIATGLFFASSCVEASISFAEGNYGTGVMSLAAGILTAYAYASTVSAIIAKSEELNALYYATTGNYPKAIPAGGYSLGDIYKIMKEISAYSTEVRSVNNAFYLTTWGGSSIRTTIEISENWFKFFNNLGKNYARDFIYWYEGTAKWILSIGMKGGAIGLDVKFSDIVIKEFEEKIKNSDETIKRAIEAQKSLILEPIKRDQVAGFINDASFQKLKASKFSNNLNSDGSIKTNPVTLVNYATGDFIESISPKNLIGLAFNYTWDPKTRMPLTKNLSETDVANVELLIADDESYRSLSQIIKKDQYNALRSNMLVFSSLNPTGPYKYLTIKIKN